MMAKEEKRVTKSRTGCLPAAKRKKTDSLDDIVSTAEKAVENQLKENHPPDPMLSPPLPSRSARKAKQPKIINSQLQQSRKGQKNSDKSTSQKQSKKVYASKAMKKENMESLLNSLQHMDNLVVQCEVSNKLRGLFQDAVLLKQFVNELSKAEQPLKDIVDHHHQCFGALYRSSKKQQDAFLHFQLNWHKHCSAFLLSEDHSLDDIGFQELPNLSVHELRRKWLDYSQKMECLYHTVTL